MSSQWKQHSGARRNRNVKVMLLPRNKKERKRLFRKWNMVKKRMVVTGM